MMTRAGVNKFGEPWDAVEKVRKAMAEHLKCQVCGLPWRGGGSTVHKEWLCADCYWWAHGIEKENINVEQ